MRGRRLVLLVVSALAGLAAGIALSFVAPPRYRVVAVVSADAGRRAAPGVAAVREALLGRAREVLQGPIAVDLVEVRERAPGEFEVSCEHPEAEVAHHTVSRLLSFLDPGAPDGGGDGGSPPLDPELAELQGRIDDLRLRIDRQGSGASDDRLLARVRGLQLDLQARDAALGEAESRLEALEARPAPPVAAPPSTELEGLRAELAALRTRYTDEHPDVRVMLARIRQAEEREARARPAAEPAADPGALAAAEVEVEGAREERDRVIAALARAEAELARSPRAGGPAADLIREHRRLQERYVTLLAEKADQESTAGSAPDELRLRVETPPRWPREPSSPSRALYAFLGLLGGLALGGVVGSLADRYDDRIREPSEVEALLRAPQLADIPEIRVSRQERERHRRRRQAP